jgi:L-aminopeptidase/D-esterase-like protein
MVWLTSTLSVWRIGASPVTSTAVLTEPTARVASMRTMVPAVTSTFGLVAVWKLAFFKATE